MTGSDPEVVLVQDDTDVIRVRRAVTRHAEGVGLSVLDRTRVVTAASELARNMLKYAGQGEVRVGAVKEANREGVRVTFEDHGPGIADLEQALTDGFTTSKGLGLGLGGARRLCEDFQIETGVEQGTKVTIARWRDS